MKHLKYLLIVIWLLPVAKVQAQNIRVEGISHSDFEEGILPYMKRPAVILFGSNYCGYSRQQLKILRNTLSEHQYFLNWMDFYSVNVDTREDSDWLESIYDSDDDERGTPTWVFYYLDEDGKPEYFYAAGNLTSSDMVRFFNRLHLESYYLKN